MTSIWDTSDEFELPGDDSRKKHKKRDAYGRAAGDDQEEKWWQQPEDFPTSRGGDSQPKPLSFRDALFDDSADNWYQRNSFRYTRVSDYSPSRLFRSSFLATRWEDSSPDNEVKNKAIRALRTLTRNANTVANKEAKISYNVRFSDGVDSNGVSDNLSGSAAKQKEQAIFVSPDTIAAAKTADEDDAAVDALTGFVLLRVQIAQSVPKEVIDAVNDTTMSAMPKKLASLLVSGTLNSETALNEATSLTDNYAAGILAKSMLTRLSRRLVVKDWGGFAPYFSRHAKQFESVRAKLEGENGKLSVEQVSAQIAYNMLADENPIPVSAEITAIVAKHLGDEVAVQDILHACQELVIDLRAYLGKLAEDKGEAPEQGKIEEALNKILAEMAGPEEDTTAAGDAKTREMLKDAAELFDKLFEHSQKFGEADELKESFAAAHAANVMINNVKIMDKFGTALSEAKAGLTAAAEMIPNNPGSAVANARYTQSMLDSHMRHFLPRVGATLDDNGLDKDELFSIANTLATEPAELEKTIKAHADKIEKFETAVAELNKKLVAELREKVTAGVEAASEKLENMLKEHNELLDATKEVATKADTLAEKFSQSESARVGLNSLHEGMTNKFVRIAKEKELLDAAANKLSRTRSAAGAQKVVTQLNNALSRANNGAYQALTELNHSLGGPISNFIYEALTAFNNVHSLRRHDAVNGTAPTAVGSWAPSAIDNYIDAANDRNGALDFNTALINSTHRELFEMLLKKISAKQEHGIVPGSFREINPELKDLVTKTAEALGMTPQELTRMLYAVQNSAKGNMAATALGAKIKSMLIGPAAEMSPVDDQLFGEQVKNTTTILTGETIGSINDESSNRAEEEFVAYLSHNSSKPILRLKKADKASATPHDRRAAAEIRARHRIGIERVRNALQFQSNKRSGEVHGLLSGDLDEGSLHKLRYDSEHIWSQKTLTKLPDVAVGILVDQSGSMGSGGKITQAREMCIILAEAVKQVSGVHLHIYGHTANRGTGSDLNLFEHYSSYGDAANADLGQLGAITAMSNNYDGYAIKETAKLLDKDPAKKKYLFIISDGLPHGAGYSGEEAQKHVTSVCSFVRTKMKIATYAFAVGQQASRDRRDFEKQYGANNTVFITSVSEALPRIVRFLRNVLQKEKTLIDATVD
jgi:hypothetical protein